MEMTFVPLALLGAAILLLVIFFYYVPFLLWISAKVSGVNISLIQLFLMRIRNVPPYVITRAMIEAHKAGLKTLTRDELEAHYLAGGHVEKVVHALVSASKANIDLPFQMATAIDLAGRDVFEAVQMSVNPKVIDTPPVTAVAKDGIQLIAKARVTVRANIKQLVGPTPYRLDSFFSSIPSVRRRMRPNSPRLDISVLMIMLCLSILS